MRRRLVHGVVAMALAITVAVTGSVTPAPATPVRTQAVSVVLDVANLITSLVNAFRGGGMSIEQATRQILAAIEGARTDIISHMDRLVAAEARACATRHVIEFADIERMTPDTLQAWAQNATSCVAQIDALISAVTDKAAQDTLGAALDVVGPIAMIARSRAGFSTSGLVSLMISGNNKVISTLNPSCRLIPGWNPPYIARQICTAYNGARAECREPFNGCTFETLSLQVMVNTSWPVAKRAVVLYSG